MTRFMVAAILGVSYLIGAGLPASSFWYHPGEVRILDADYGTAPEIEFFREIKRKSKISYSVTVRDQHSFTACEGRGGPFTYEPQVGPLTGRDLVWWTAGDTRCANLPRGDYWAETTWKVETPLAALLPAFLKGAFGWLLPPKTVTRFSPHFKIK